MWSVKHWESYTGNCFSPAKLPSCFPQQDLHYGKQVPNWGFCWLTNWQREPGAVYSQIRARASGRSGHFSDDRCNCTLFLHSLESSKIKRRILRGGSNPLCFLITQQSFTNSQIREKKPTINKKGRTVCRQEDTTCEARPRECFQVSRGHDRLQEERKSGRGGQAKT